ncbi:TetR/AcrR family transcriptional regulator [Psychroflexus sp. MBR-150]|jgi:AcrR family transcriptional regulator
MKKKIIQKAMSLFLEYGFKSVTMDEISEQLGISKKTLYDHFDSKTNLVKVTTTYVFDNISSTIDKLRAEKYDPIEETLAIENQVMRHLKNEKSSPQYQLQKYYPQIFKTLKNKIWHKYDYCIENFRRGIKEGFYRPNIDIEVIFRLYYYGMNLLKDQKVFPVQEFSNQDIQDHFLEYHLRGIVSEKGLNRLEELLAQQSKL